jgi:membrane-bound lytic murein transglycosylase B
MIQCLPLCEVGQFPASEGGKEGFNKMRKLTMTMIILGLIINSGQVQAAYAEKQTLKLPIAVKNVVERKTEVEQRYSYQVQLFESKSLDNLKKQIDINNTNIQKGTNIEIALSNAGYSPKFAHLYKQASEKYGVPWQVIAAVHVVETHQSDSTVVASYAGAMGPMQFIPGTFSAYAQDGNNDGKLEITNVYDAVYSAANYLRANGAANGNVTNALLAYNHSGAYVNYVLGIANKLGY